MILGLWFLRGKRRHWEKWRLEWCWLGSRFESCWRIWSIVASICRRSMPKVFTNRSSTRMESSQIGAHLRWSPFISTVAISRQQGEVGHGMEQPQGIRTAYEEAASMVQFMLMILWIHELVHDFDLLFLLPGLNNASLEVCWVHGYLVDGKFCPSRRRPCRSRYHCSHPSTGHWRVGTGQLEIMFICIHVGTDICSCSMHVYLYPCRYHLLPPSILPKSHVVLRVGMRQISRGH